jgi:hypothetical protein
MIRGFGVLDEQLQDQGSGQYGSREGALQGADPLTPDNYPWYKGALGEIAVGQILERLGPEWTILHAVPVGGGAFDIDHVLIGPAGVFTLNTKNHAGQHAAAIEPATGRHSRLALIPVPEPRCCRGISRLQRPLGKIRDDVPKAGRPVFPTPAPPLHGCLGPHHPARLPASWSAIMPE